PPRRDLPLGPRRADGPRRGARRVRSGHQARGRARGSGAEAVGAREVDAAAALHGRAGRPVLPRQGRRDQLPHRRASGASAPEHLRDSRRTSPQRRAAGFLAAAAPERGPPLRGVLGHRLSRGAPSSRRRGSTSVDTGAHGPPLRASERPRSAEAARRCLPITHRVGHGSRQRVGRLGWKREQSETQRT
ncbi:unnamed protein product, partial [Prorocentrum cordatum]